MKTKSECLAAYSTRAGEPVAACSAASASVRRSAAARKPPQEGALQQLGVEPVGYRSAMLPRYCDTLGVDDVSLDAARRKPARQPEAVAAGFEGQRNPRNRAAGPGRLILPAMQQAKQPFWARLQLLVG